MKLAFDKDIIDGRVTVTATASAFTQTENNLMASYGEPIVDIGGEFYIPPSSTPIPLPSTPTASPLPPVIPAYVHSNMMKKISTDFNPLQIVFDGNTLGVDKAMADANVWIATMELRFEDAMAGLRLRANNFKQSESVNI